MVFSLYVLQPLCAALLSDWLIDYEGSSYMLCTFLVSRNFERWINRSEGHKRQAGGNSERVSSHPSDPFHPITLILNIFRWWGPKVLLWFVLVAISFLIPNGFFIFWGNYVSLIGATIFILLGLVLLVDFAHSWSETCLENWEASPSSNLWQWILIGSTGGMYLATIALTGVLYAFFTASGCTLNKFFISFNLALCVLITILCIHPTVQEYNPRSGLAQSSMVAAYCTYLVMSAVGNHAHETCNPLRSGAATGTRTTAVVVGAAFTFLAIAYSTTRAATQSRALVGKKKYGSVQLPIDPEEGHEVSVVSTQPGRTESPRYQALLAAVEAGYEFAFKISVMLLLRVFFMWMNSAIPASALQEEEDEEEEVELGEMRDDERSGTRYNVRCVCPAYMLAISYYSIASSTPGSTSSSPLERCTSPCCSRTGMSLFPIYIFNSHIG